MAAAFRLFSELETFYGQSGQLLAGGYLKFYTAGTTTPKNVYGEEALSTNNGSTVDLDSSGRPSVDVWGSGSYFVELYDADDVKQGEADDVQVPGGEATALPALSAGKFLTNDGSVMSWATIRQVPDPTGSASKVLGTDGTALIWQEITDPAVPDPEIVVDEGRFQGGVSTNETKHLTLYGSASAAASGTLQTSVAVVFSETFSTIPAIVLSPTGGGVTPGGCFVRHSVTAVSTSGFTANFSTKTGGTSADNFGNSNITSAVAFDWAAFGTKEVAA